MNVLLITTDQQRADTLGVEGSPLGATPRLDAFAAQGTRLLGGAHAEPVVPAGARHDPHRHVSVDARRDVQRHRPARSTPKRVRSRRCSARAGYRTAIFGKAHFATTFPFLPTGRIESVEGSAQRRPRMERSVLRFRTRRADALRPQPAHRRPDGEVELDLRAAAVRPALRALSLPRRLRARRRALAADAARSRGRDSGTTRQTWRNALPEEDHPTTWVADRACDWLDDVDGPFFAWVSFTDPHHPMDAPAPWCDRYSPADVLEVLPEVHPNEHDDKSAVAQRALARHARPRTGVGEPRWCEPDTRGARA